MKEIFLDKINHTINVDGEEYRYNIVSRNRNKNDFTYFCEGNVIIKEGIVKKLDKKNKLLIDTYIVDINEKSIKNLDSVHTEVLYNDSFIKSIGKIKNIEINEGQNGEKTIIITPENGENVFIDISARGEIESYINANISSIDSYFLYRNSALKTLYVPNVNYIGDFFMPNNKKLKNLIVSNALENQAVLSRFKSIINFEEEDIKE